MHGENVQQRQILVKLLVLLQRKSSRTSMTALSVHGNRPHVCISIEAVGLMFASPVIVSDTSTL
jgi:hypothetical protein